jgi:hypothetical protein
MPKTHAAFQQALSELSECKHKVNEVSRDQSKKEIPKFLDYSENCSMRRHKDYGGFVHPEISGMERDEMGNNFDKFIHHLRLVLPMDLNKILLNIILPVIHFAITARTLFAAMVSHHNNYNHECKKKKKDYYKETICVSWKVNAIDFREVLTHDDGESFFLVKWKVKTFIIKEILTHNDGEDFSFSLISKLRMRHCDPHTRNDGVCHVKVFNLLKYLVHYYFFIAM